MNIERLKTKFLTVPASAVRFTGGAVTLVPDNFKDAMAAVRAEFAAKGTHDEVQVYAMACKRFPDLLAAAKRPKRALAPGKPVSAPKASAPQPPAPDSHGMRAQAFNLRHR
jgi:hypothetical protein